MELRSKNPDPLADRREARPPTALRPGARSRRELFHETCAIVFDLAPAWSTGGAATVVLSDPLLTRALVRSAFDEISEKFRVTGISLRFDEQEAGGLRAIFEPRPDLALTPARSAQPRSPGDER